MTGYDRSLYQSFLAQVPMFRSCTPEQLDRLADLGTAVGVSEGKPIVGEGDPGEEFFVITSGTASVSHGGKKVAQLGAGDYFGELALFDPAPRNATVTATSGVALVTLSRSAFGKVLDEIPTIRDSILHGMAHRLHELDAKA
jgi:CRP/FNR family cyclic AMP-dependent transcriptional regulator